MANFSKPARQPGHLPPARSQHANKEPNLAKNTSRSDTATNTAEDRGREHVQRSRKASSKVQEQRAQEAQELQRREDKAVRQAQRAQRNKADTEDEDKDDGLNPNAYSDENDENDNQFSSRVVHTKLSKASSQMAPRAPLVHTQDQIPISSSTVDEEAEPDFADVEDDQNLALSKRCRSSNSIESLRDAKAQKVTANTRPKASDYDDVVKECITEAITEYRCLISAEHPFPDHATETQLSHTAWDAACDELDCNATLTTRIAKLITIRGSHTRGELKTKARLIVEMFYQFESGQNKKIIASNRELAEALKDGMGYAYKVHHSEHLERKGLYQSKLIQKVLNAMWFRNRQDEGVVYEGFFRPIRQETIALILTVIECCIDEWITGIRTDCQFTAAAYRDVYDEHLRCISDFANHAKSKGSRLFENICEKLYNRGRFHAGAQPILTIARRAIPTSAFEAAIKEYNDDDKTETDGETGDSQ